jgi:hypothetical protein
MPQILPGAQVVGFFMDGEESQLPLVLGAVPRFEIPSEQQLVAAQNRDIGYGVDQTDPATARENSLSYNSAGSSRGTTSNTGIPQYPSDVSIAWIEQQVRQESILRGIDPNVAVRLWKAEGAGSYQSGVTSGNQLKRGGREASYGPFQLYVGGGMGNDYETATGRDLRNDNSQNGVTNQVRYALDRVVTRGWSPWYGRIPAGIGVRDGIPNSAKTINNWS